MKELFQKIINPPPYLLLGGAVLVAGATAAVAPKTEPSQAANPPPIKLVVDERPVSREPKLGASFAPIVKKVAPSVVKVTTATRGKEASLPDFPGFENPFFRRFFGDDFELNTPKRHFRMPRQHGVGSGVIVTKDGYILTNNHVVEEADEVRVVLQDGRDFNGKVIGKDPKTDIGVLKIDAHDLPYMELADSEKIEVGDIVLAIGNPFGIGQTV